MLTKEEEYEFILAIANSDLKISRVAKQLYISNSTVRWRIARIKRKTGLNPLRFWDLIILLTQFKE